MIDDCNKVVVTGLGVISSIGIGKQDFWQNLIAGKSGISQVSMFDTSKFDRHKAGEIKNFEPNQFIPKHKQKFLGRASQFAIAATKLALDDAGLLIKDIVNVRTSVIIGTTLPEGTTLDQSTRRFVSDQKETIWECKLASLFPPSISANVANFFSEKIQNYLVPCACAAGNYAISCGFDLIRNKQIDIALVGGSEALSRLTFQGFQMLRGMAQEICSPFDKNRQGMMLGEGAGILILESQKHALARQAKIYAQISGYGLSCDANHITIPDKTGVKKAMQKALANSGILPEQIDYISAHGTGTVANDKNESQAINELFMGRKVAVSSIKSMLGHSLGAASALASIACCLAVQKQTVPATINFKETDPDCDIDCIPNQSREVKVGYTLNNGFAFGGNNCCMVFNQQ